MQENPLDVAIEACVSRKWLKDTRYDMTGTLNSDNGKLSFLISALPRLYFHQAMLDSFTQKLEENTECCISRSMLTTDSVYKRLYFYEND